MEDSVQVSRQKIPTDEFGNEEITIHAFGNIAKEYGYFLKENGIKGMYIWGVDKNYVDKWEKPFVKQIWFGSLDHRSDLLGRDRLLDCDHWVRGIKFNKQ